MRDERVGFIDVEVDGERGGIAIYVRREFRGRRSGQQLLRLAAAEGPSLGIVELVGSVESDNVAAAYRRQLSHASAPQAK